jgi:ribosome-associated heat shock protein Hsp15
VRIDRLLWFLRLAASRSFAQQWAQAGHIRLNGRRVVKSSAAIAAGDVLTLPMRGHVRVIEILALPARRGPAAEAQACYRVLDDGRPIDIAGSKPQQYNIAREEEGYSQQ